MQQNLGGNEGSLSVCLQPPLGSVYDAAPNDSSKEYVVPANEMWKLNFAHVILVSTSTVGSREIVMSVLDAQGNLLIDIAAGATQAASLTQHYGFFQGIFRETAFIDNEIEVPMPIDCYLGPGYTLRFADSKAIAPTADDLTVAFQYQKFRTGS